MITISMTDANDFYETVIIDTVQYNLHFAWNDHAQAWAMDVRDGKNTDIVRGIALVPNFPLLHQYRRHVGLPGGEFVAVITSPVMGNEKIGRTDFITGKASMVYIPEAELNDIMASTV